MSILDWIYLAIVSVAAIFAVFRMFKGPDVTDRVVGLDVLTTITVALFVFFAMVFDRYIYIDVALVYGLLAFVGVLVIARFIERGF
jgi:multicomponent Na+:H+ antiporter subunit F